ncbi:N-carbamoylputrescine amidase [Sporobacter termitidis DSM 10068]|uniref:N-carbamoylputrescine amidase n=1 Tax=Sporobacter termitidis DSM 10068 TaxID=1123282 RepID=A0A1M5XE35_9FIRM|nr:N-carbamoylputrescine amidase [Sporobacter termitidis]SHH98117.1 N-carbamoylputrescine amidase [Sporobacter termitidis DSM 10068]
MKNVMVAATQMACSWNAPETLDKAEGLVREAAGRGAQIILLQELFETPYFCAREKYEYYALAHPLGENPAVARFRAVARELGVVLPVSFFERAGNTAFNSVAVIDADGAVLGVYRKTHIPQGSCYEEKFYFSPGDTGFKVWDTAYAKIGVGVCWDQWFPESARCMALLGAEILFYPTAIGSEPVLDFDSEYQWQTVMQGHAAANIMPLVASNRVGTETDDGASLTFYGSSFIAGPEGRIAAQADRESAAVITAGFDLEEIRRKRQYWGVFRDRRPECYGAIAKMDGA